MKRMKGNMPDVNGIGIVPASGEIVTAVRKVINDEQFDLSIEADHPLMRMNFKAAMLCREELGASVFDQMVKNDHIRIERTAMIEEQEKLFEGIEVTDATNDGD